MDKCGTDVDPLGVLGTTRPLAVENLWKGGPAQAIGVASERAQRR